MDSPRLDAQPQKFLYRSLRVPCLYTKPPDLLARPRLLADALLHERPDAIIIRKSGFGFNPPLGSLVSSGAENQPVKGA